MSRNTRETRLPADLLDNERFLSLGTGARLVYLTVRMLADDEGRFVAAPPVLEANGRLTDMGQDAIAAALAEAAHARLVALYTHDGRRFGFLPDAFANPGGIAFWARSALPLPPDEALALYPSYRRALSQLDGHGRLGFNGELWTTRRDAPRYARELWPDLWARFAAQNADYRPRRKGQRDNAGHGGTDRDTGGAGADAGAGAGALSPNVGEVVSGGGVFEGGRRRRMGG